MPRAFAEILGRLIKRNLQVSPRNANYWMQQNLHWVLHANHQCQWSNCVHDASLYYGNVTGSCSYDGSLHGTQYVEDMFSGPADSPQVDLPLLQCQELWFQYDGTSWAECQS